MNYAYLAKSFPARVGNAAVRLVPMASESWLLVNEISLTFPAVTILPNSALPGTAFNLLSKRTKVLDRERVAWLMLTILLGIITNEELHNPTSNPCLATPRKREVSMLKCRKLMPLN